MLREMVVNGGLTILMITHKFREGDGRSPTRVTILRRGKLAGHGKGRRSHPRTTWRA